jgi:MFS family permease
MFTNNKFCAFTDFASMFFGGYFYKTYGLKKTYYVSISLGIIGGMGVLYLEMMHSQMNQLVSDSQFDFFNKWMPICIAIGKFGIAISFLASYFASFIDDRIFPIEHRATAIGICNIGARSLTGLSPIISELREPMPMVFFVASLFIAIICNSTINL